MQPNDLDDPASRRASPALGWAAALACAGVFLVPAAHARVEFPEGEPQSCLLLLEPERAAELGVDYIDPGCVPEPGMVLCEALFEPPSGTALRCGPWRPSDRRLSLKAPPGEETG